MNSQDKIYRKNLKNWNFDKEDPQNLHSERGTIAEWQGPSENANSEGNSTQSKTNSSSCFGIKPVHVMHRKSDRNNVDIFFDCGEWNGSIINNETEKCAACAFYSLETPPSPLIDYIAAALKSIEQGHFYSEYGWHRI